MHASEDETTDGILGITRCVRCGHRLDGDVECPFCAIVEAQQPAIRHSVPLWVFCTASFLTAPLSAWWVLSSRRLGPWAKAVVLSGSLLWALAAGLWWIGG